MSWLEELGEVAERASAVLGELDVERCSGEDAERLLDAFVKLERIGAAGKTLCAGRVVDTNRWCQGGVARSPEDFLSRKTGVSTSAAGRLLDNADRLKELPDTREALAQGTLSEEQLGLVSRAAPADPGAERRLLDTAAREDLKTLKDRCRQATVRARETAGAEPTGSGCARPATCGPGPTRTAGSPASSA